MEERGPIASLFADVGDKLTGVGDKIRDNISDVGERIRDVGDKVKDSVAGPIVTFHADMARMRAPDTVQESSAVPSQSSAIGADNYGEEAYSWQEGESSVQEIGPIEASVRKLLPIGRNPELEPDVAARSQREQLLRRTNREVGLEEPPARKVVEEVGPIEASVRKLTELGSRLSELGAGKPEPPPVPELTVAVAPLYPPNKWKSLFRGEESTRVVYSRPRRKGEVIGEMSDEAGAIATARYSISPRRKSNPGEGGTTAAAPAAAPDAAAPDAAAPDADAPAAAATAAPGGASLPPSSPAPSPERSERARQRFGRSRARSSAGALPTSVSLAQIREGEQTLAEIIDPTSSETQLYMPRIYLPAPHAGPRAGKIKGLVSLRRPSARVHATCGVPEGGESASSRSTTPGSSSSSGGGSELGSPRGALSPRPVSVYGGREASVGRALAEWAVDDPVAGGGVDEEDEELDALDARLAADTLGVTRGNTDDASSFNGSEWSRLAWWGDDAQSAERGREYDLRELLGYRRPRVRTVIDAAKERGAKASAFVDRRRDDLVKRRENATAVIKRHAREKKRKMGEKAISARERVGGKAANVRDKAAAARDVMAEKREAAAAVLQRNLKRFRARRAAATRREEGGGGRAAKRPLRESMRRHRRTKSGEGSARSPRLRPASHSPPPETEGSASLFTTSELALGRQMCTDWRQRPRDKPHADLIYNKETLRVWRWKGEVGPGGVAVDEYESEFEVPIVPESFVAMQTETDARPAWDTSSKEVCILRAGGPTDLKYIHGFDGDAMAIFWSLEAPWPLKDREYVLHRRVCRLHCEPSAAGGGPDLFLRIDIGNDAPESRALRPAVAKGAIRCVDHKHVQAAWPTGDGQSVRVRSRYREDPMTKLPSFLIGMITDKMLPRGLASLRKAAVERDRRLAQQAA